jgi:hypothetical protein
MAKVKSNVENPIEAAEKILADLQQKRGQVAAYSADELQLGEVAYLAQMGDEKAIAKLEVLQKLANQRREQLSVLDPAIAAAERKLAEARANEAATEQRRAIEEARVIVDRIDSLFASADTHFKQAFDALKAADGRIEELHVRGFAFPTAIQVRTNALFALETYLMSLPKYWWNELSHGGVRFLAPYQRRSFRQFWAETAKSLGREIAIRLGETKHNKEGGENVAA